MVWTILLQERQETKIQRIFYLLLQLIDESTETRAMQTVPTNSIPVAIFPLSKKSPKRPSPVLLPSTEMAKPAPTAVARSKLISCEIKSLIIYILLVASLPQEIIDNKLKMIEIQIKLGTQLYFGIIKQKVEPNVTHYQQSLFWPAKYRKMWGEH